MKTLDPQAASQKWAQNLSASTDRIKKGVMATQESPGAAAARQVNTYLANVQAAVASGKTAAALNYPLQTWQQGMTNKGIQRIQTGATAAQPKVANVMQSLFAHIQGVVASLPPRGSEAANEQRALQMMRGMKQYKKPVM